VLFLRSVLDGIAAGTITLTFRRWKRPAARPGSLHRTAIGVVAIDSVELVRPRQITVDDARRAGFPTKAALLADLAKFQEAPIYRIGLRFAGPDPRAELRQRAELSDDDVGELSRRLARFDAASSHGPWTMTTLALIRDRPAVRAGDLADSVGRERLPFKVDVRKLKELGLTESLEIGYRLSPRGEEYLRRRG
jgi:hypothetical protein